MTSSIKSTILAALVTISVSVGGGWIVSAKQQTANTVRIESLESDINTIKLDTKGLSSYGIRLDLIDDRMGKHEEWIEEAIDKMQEVQISNERTTVALEKLTDSVEKLSESTSTLTEVAIRLDERVNRLEERTE